MSFHTERKCTSVATQTPCDSRATEAVEVFGWSQKHQQRSPALAQLRGDQQHSTTLQPGGGGTRTRNLSLGRGV